MLIAMMMIRIFMTMIIITLLLLILIPIVITITIIVTIIFFSIIMIIVIMIIIITAIVYYLQNLSILILHHCQGCINQRTRNRKILLYSFLCFVNPHCHIYHSDSEMDPFERQFNFEPVLLFQIKPHCLLWISLSVPHC